MLGMKIKIQDASNILNKRVRSFSRICKHPVFVLAVPPKAIAVNGRWLWHTKCKMFHFGLAFINMKYKKVNAKLPTTMC